MYYFQIFTYASFLLDNSKYSFCFVYVYFMLLSQLHMYTCKFHMIKKDTLCNETTILIE